MHIVNQGLIERIHTEGQIVNVCARVHVRGAMGTYTWSTH